MMFRIECFVDDNKLPKLLHNMTGLILGPPNVQPVANGAVKKGKAVAANSGEVCDLFRAYVKKHKLTKIKAPQLREFCTTSGWAANSYSYVVKKLFECKLVRKHGAGAAMYYTVVAK